MIIYSYMRKYAYNVVNSLILRMGTMRQLIKAFKALSDETRIRMLNLLLKRECCVCEVMQVLGISESRASRNLSALYDAGFLKLRREGLWALYSIDRENLADHYLEIIEAVKKLLEGNKTAQEDIIRLQNAERVGPDWASRCCRA
jgi:ArsR family transcriptional regulator